MICPVCLFCLLYVPSISSAHLPHRVLLRTGYSSVGKASALSAGDLGSIPESGILPGEGNGNPLQYSCLEDPMDRGAWQATVCGMARVGHDLALSFFLSMKANGIQY